MGNQRQKHIQGKYQVEMEAEWAGDAVWFVEGLPTMKSLV